MMVEEERRELSGELLGLLWVALRDLGRQTEI
jgi:hypothetical protein